jgi:CHAT domain-containing protein
LFIEAEPIFATRGDTPKALYAKLGGIRSTMEQLSLPEVSLMLEAELENNPLMKTDKQLRLFCLTVKGDIDGELDSEPARRDWEAALQLARELGDAKWQNRASAELGFAVFLEGDVAKAQQMIGSAVIAATVTKDVGAQMRYLAAIGTALAWTGLPEQALGYFDRAANAAAQTPESGYQYLIVTGKVIALREAGRLDEAETLVTDLIAHARADHKRVKEAQALISASSISTAKKNYSRAAEQLQAAVALAKEGRFTRLLADAQFELSSVYRTIGDLPRAAQLAAEAALASQSSGEIYELPKRLQYEAELEVSLGKYAEADATYTRAADFVDIMLRKVSRAATKSALITASSQIFEKHFALIAEHLNNPSKAYEVVERARGRATTDLIRTGYPVNDYDQAVERQISQLHLDLSKATSATEIRKIHDDIFLAEQSRWATPTNTLATQARHAIPIQQIRDSLGVDELLLSYVLSEPYSYCLIIRREGGRIVSLASRSEIEDLVSSYLKTIRSKAADRDAGRAIFEKLLKPVSEIGEKSRLIIVRDGRLHLLPFDALVDGERQYVAQTHTVTYGASAAEWYLLKTTPGTRPADRMLLAVGGIPYDESLAKIATTRGFAADGLGNLPGSKDEILAASEALDPGTGTLLMGPTATEYAFKNAELNRYKLIHMAVHGVANHDRPEQAALILLSDSDKGEDGILQASEILQLRTNADLVVLSACDTAIGRIQGAEGIANLARAFLLSGARTVVATLWAVDDTFTLNLMKQFYKHLTAGSPMAEALTEAKRDILRTYGTRAVPYYWAAFTLEGIGESVLLKTVRQE